MLHVELPRILCVVANIRDEQRTWVASILQATGWTLTELARRIGVHQTTLTRWDSDPNDKATLSARTVDAIARVTGFYPYSPARIGILREPNAGDVIALPEVLRPDIQVAMHSLIAGRNAVFARVIRSRVLETMGYMPDDICIVDQNEPARRGDVVVATVFPPAGRAETVLRLYEPPFLVSATFAPGQRRPLFVDNDQVAIVGVVVALLRARLPA